MVALQLTNRATNQCARGEGGLPHQPSVYMKWGHQTWVSLRLLPAGVILRFPKSIWSSLWAPWSQTDVDKLAWGQHTPAAMIKGKGRLAPWKIKGADTSVLGWAAVKGRLTNVW